MHSPRPVSAESTLRGRTARALYHIPAGMCQKTPIRTDREGERTRIRTGGTINTSMPQHRNAKPAPSPAEQVRLPLQWCVYFRALRENSAPKLEKCEGRQKLYFAPLVKLQVEQSIWQLSGVVCPPFDQGLMWSAFISSMLNFLPHILHTPPCLV